MPSLRGSGVPEYPDVMGATVEQQSVAAALRRFPRRALDRPALKRSAVGITLTVEDFGSAFLLTRRAARLRGHAGQWALPGGRTDGAETPGETARRELAEELGLALGPEAELGLLDDYATRSGYVITPVVLWAGPSPALVPNPAEVAELHRVALADLDVEPRYLTIPESDAPVIQLPLLGRNVHAPTGAVLHQFREVVLHGRDTRVAHLEQPVFAWR
jgi:8-oxo-dGTP pyrophosphatase MutT (NUDIX family)